MRFSSLMTAINKPVALLFLVFGIYMQGSVWMFDGRDLISTEIEAPRQEAFQVHIQKENGSDEDIASIISDVKNQLTQFDENSIIDSSGRVSISDVEPLFFDIDTLVEVRSILESKTPAQLLGIPLDSEIFPRLEDQVVTKDGRDAPVLTIGQTDGLAKYSARLDGYTMSPAFAGERTELTLEIANIGETDWKGSDVFLITDQPYRYNSELYDPTSWIGQSVVRSLNRDVPIEKTATIRFDIQLPIISARYTDITFGLGLKRGDTWLPIPLQNAQMVLDVHTNDLEIEAPEPLQIKPLLASYKSTKQWFGDDQQAFLFVFWNGKDEPIQHAKTLQTFLNDLSYDTVSFTVSHPSEAQFVQADQMMQLFHIVWALIGLVFICIVGWWSQSIVLTALHGMFFVMSAGYIHAVILWWSPASLYLYPSIQLCFFAMVLFFPLHEILFEKQPKIFRSCLDRWRLAIWMTGLLFAMETVIGFLMGWETALVFALVTMLSILLVWVVYPLYMEGMFAFLRTNNASYYPRLDTPLHFSFPASFPSWVPLMVSIGGSIALIAVLFGQSLNIHLGTFSLPSLSATETSSYITFDPPPKQLQAATLEELAAEVQTWQERDDIALVDSLSDVVPDRMNEKIPLLVSLREISFDGFQFENEAYLAFAQELQSYNSTCKSWVKRYGKTVPPSFDRYCTSIQNLLNEIEEIDFLKWQDTYTGIINSYMSPIQALPKDLRPVAAKDLLPAPLLQGLKTTDGYAAFAYFKPDAAKSSISNTVESFSLVVWWVFLATFALGLWYWIVWHRVLKQPMYTSILLSTSMFLALVAALYTDSTVSLVMLFLLIVLLSLSWTIQTILHHKKHGNWHAIERPLLIYSGLIPMAFLILGNIEWYVVTATSIVYLLVTFICIRHSMPFQWKKLLPSNIFKKKSVDETHIRHKIDVPDDAFHQHASYHTIHAVKNKVHEFVPMHVSREKTSLRIELEIGFGISIEDIDVYVSDGVLHVNAAPHLEHKHFERHISVPPEADITAIDIEIEGKELIITLPLTELLATQPLLDPIQVEQDPSSILSGSSHFSIEEIKQQTDHDHEYNEQLHIHMKDEGEYIVIEVFLEGRDPKLFDIQADENTVFLRSTDASIFQCFKDVQLPRTIDPEGIISQLTENSILIKLTPQSL